MSQRAEVHLLLELSPEQRVSSMFGEMGLDERAGVHSAEAALRGGYLAEAVPFLSKLASFDLVVHTSPRALSLDALRTGMAAAARIWALRPDVLHIEEESSRSVPLFFLTPRVPKLLAVHDAQPHPGERVGRGAMVRRLVLPCVSHLLFYSQYSRDVFFGRTRNRPSSVVPLGIREIFRELPGPDSVEHDPSLLFFGRIAPYKGLEILYSALPRIARRVPRLRVVVAGRPGGGYQPPEPPSLPSDTEFITRFETIDNATLRRLFQEASIVVVPYVEASQSGVVQTAYAFGKPVVASAIGGLREAVRDGVTGRLVPPGDPDALTEAVTQLLLDVNARARMREGIRDREEMEFGWHLIGRQLHAVYEATAAGAQGRAHGSATYWP